MDIKLKYKAWIGEKHADIAHKLMGNDIETFALDFAEHLVKNCIPDVVRSVFTIHSTEDEGIIKIVGTEEEAKEEVKAFKKQHKYADFFYEKQNVF